MIYFRGFRVRDESWFALHGRSDTNCYVSEVEVGLYRKEDSAYCGSFSIMWEDLDPDGDEPCVVSDIQAGLKDSWAFTYYDDLFNALALMNTCGMEPTEVCDLLLELGVKNMTPMQ